VVVRRVGFAAVLAIWGITALGAQQPKPVFEVASVKPQTAPLTAALVATMSPRVRPGGIVSASATTVEMLIAFAYDLQSVQIVGGPDWIRRDRFEIDARAGAGATAGQVKLMVQSLLQARFMLIGRTERRDMRHLALVLARTDGQPGPYLRAVDDCEPETIAEARKRFPPGEPAGAGGRLSGCGELRRVTSVISSQFQVPVIDETGLSGTWVFSAHHAGWPGLPGRPGLPAGGIDHPNLPSVATALEEQLGLRLESRRGPVDVMVIESVQPPTGN
jgi:uncharacterized protein (TIGR03435 family)